MSRLIIFLLVVGILAACGQPGSTLLPQATSPVPTQPLPTASVPTQPAPTGTPIRVDLTPAQRAAIQMLIEAIKVPVDQIQLISTDAVQWPDGCLGIVRINARCMGDPVEGFCIIGGYIPFAGASGLYRVNVNERSVQDVIPYSVDGGQMIYLDELSSDERLVADHCTQTSIAIRDLSSGQTTTIQPPAEATGFGLGGSARFSPDLARVAFALAKRDPENEQGWVAVSDGLSGGSKLIVTGQPGEYFTVAGWLNADTLLLQSNPLLCNPTCTNALWAVKVDGCGLTPIDDGTFLTLLD